MAKPQPSVLKRQKEQKKRERRLMKDEKRAVRQNNQRLQKEAGSEAANLEAMQPMATGAEPGTEL